MIIRMPMTDTITPMPMVTTRIHTTMIMASIRLNRMHTAGVFTPIFLRGLMVLRSPGVPCWRLAYRAGSCRARPRL